MKTETQLEEMFGGGPELPPTHWMERYATASARAENLAAEITTLVSENKRLRDALTALFEWGRSHISPTHNPDGHAAMLLAYEALNPKGNNQ